MSKKRTVQITCRNCGKQGDYVVWDSLNTTLDPDAKEKLLNNELFRYRCPHCGNQVQAMYPFLYNQMESQLMIQYITPQQNPQDYVDEWEKSIKLMMSQFGIESERYLIVNSYNRLKEKIFITDRNMDDRAVEIMKVLLFSQILKMDPNMEIAEMFLAFEDNKPKEWRLQLADGRWAAMEYDRGLYGAVKKMIDENLQPDDSHIIDFKWAGEALRKMNKN